MVILISREFHALAGYLRLVDAWTGTNGGFPEISCQHVLHRNVLQTVLWQDVKIAEHDVQHIIQVGGVLQCKLYCVGVNGLHAEFLSFHTDSVFRTGKGSHLGTAGHADVRVGHEFCGVYHVVSRHRLSVMPLGVFVQVKCNLGMGLIIHGPGICQTGFKGSVCLYHNQLVKNQLQHGVRVGIGGVKGNQGVPRGRHGHGHDFLSLGSSVLLGIAVCTAFRLGVPAYGCCSCCGRGLGIAGR